MGALAHVSPTLYNTWRRGGGPHTILHAATGISASLEFRDLSTPLVSIGCVTDLQKRKSVRFQTLYLHSRRTVYGHSCILAGLLGHLHDACRRRQAMMPRSSWTV